MSVTVNRKGKQIVSKWIEAMAEKSNYKLQNEETIQARQTSRLGIGAKMQKKSNVSVTLGPFPNQI